MDSDNWFWLLSVTMFKRFVGTSFYTQRHRITIENLFLDGQVHILFSENKSILLKEPFALKNSETVYFTSIFSTPSYSDIAPIDNFDLTFFYFYFVFEVFDTIQF